MIIGFIGFGKVSQNLVKLIQSEEIVFITSFEGRSKKTADNIKKSGICVLDSFREVAIKADILISANSPNNALDVAKQYGKFSKGIFLDLNNISPRTTMEINKHVNNLVDGAIIGKIDSDSPVLYISGKRSDELLFLNEFIRTKKISDNLGDVAVLKLLRSSYTKSVSAILIESVDIAREYGLEDEFFEILSLTEGENFREKSISRVNNTLDNSKRKSEELNEILDYFGDDLIMVRAAQKKINQ
jgi:3-hydroxyisobutyrate dehydrogenase-like beta-hydroxyacid dehydrogenase